MLRHLLQYTHQWRWLISGGYRSYDAWWRWLQRCFDSKLTNIADIWVTTHSNNFLEETFAVWLSDLTRRTFCSCRKWIECQMGWWIVFLILKPNFDCKICLCFLLTNSSSLHVKIQSLYFFFGNKRVHFPCSDHLWYVTQVSLYVLLNKFLFCTKFIKGCTRVQNSNFYTKVICDIYI